MNNHLLEKGTLMIETSLAKELGLNKAVFIRQLHYWLLKSKHIKDGKKWVFNTLEQWLEQFPFWSRSTLLRIIKDLEKDKYIFTKQYDKNLLNRTNWYTINYEKIEELKEKLKPTSIESKKEDKKVTKKSPNEGAKIQSDGFKEFWSAYPRKTGGKALALTQFEKLSKDEKKRAIYSASRYALSVSETEEKYIKTAKKWLEHRYFEDYEIEKKEIKNNEKISIVDVLEGKITYLIDKKFPLEVEIWEQMEGQKMIFTQKEQETLKELGNSLEDYKEMEYQKGQIRAYLQGVL